MAKSYKCPDCGMVMGESCPDKCPKCACPSSYFVESEIVEKPCEISQNSQKSKRRQRQNIILIVVGIVVIGMGVYLMSYTNLLHNFESWTSHSNESQQGEPVSAPEYIPTIDDYPEIYNQTLVCEKKFRMLQNEVENVVPQKATMSTYQGVFAQKILGDANHYMQEYQDETKKLIRLLKQYHFEDEAQVCERDLQEKKEWYRDYHDEVMRLLGVW